MSADCCAVCGSVTCRSEMRLVQLRQCGLVEPSGQTGQAIQQYTLDLCCRPQSTSSPCREQRSKGISTCNFTPHLLTSSEPVACLQLTAHDRCTLSKPIPIAASLKAMSLLSAAQAKSNVLHSAHLLLTVPAATRVRDTDRTENQQNQKRYFHIG